MKTNYGKLGQESMDSLRDTSKRSAEVQMQLLADLSLSLLVSST